MNLQQKIVQTLQNEIPDCESLSVDTVFANYRNNKGLQLTDDGLYSMRKLFTAYTININSEFILKTRHRLVLDKHMEYPYHIAIKKSKPTFSRSANFSDQAFAKKTITLFSELDYLELKMYDGDLDAWCKAKDI